jgi:SAM-dependent methyltransferase
MSAHPTPSDPTDGRYRHFDAGSYWETWLRNHPGLCGVGNMRLGKRCIQWLNKVRRAIFLCFDPYPGTDRGTSQVLDIGSGTGFYLRMWIEAGVRSVVGSDRTEIVVSRLRSEFPRTRILQLDIGDALQSLSPGQFDLVSAFDVLFHIVQDGRYEQAVRNVHTLLRPGGICVLGSPRAR